MKWRFSITVYKIGLITFQNDKFWLVIQPFPGVADDYDTYSDEYDDDYYEDDYDDYDETDDEDIRVTETDIPINED